MRKLSGSGKNTELNMENDNDLQMNQGGSSDPGTSQKQALPALLSSSPASSKDFDEMTMMGITTSMKLYIRPFVEVMPNLVDIPPYNTERVRSEQADIGLPHTPWTWMDPLRMYGIQYDYPAGGVAPHAWVAGQVNYNAPDLAIKIVEVTRTMRSEIINPQFSQLATVIKDYLNTSLTSSTMATAQALQPVRFQRDLQATAGLIAILPSDPLSYYEEAAMLRLSLLHLVFVTADHLNQTSSIVQQVFANCMPSQIPAVAWSALPPAGTANCNNIPVAAGTVNMCAMPLDVYVQWTSGAWENRNAAWTNINPNTVVVVPVQSQWSGQEWLIPYILSFTTTSWWNFSRTVTYAEIALRLTGVEVENAEVRALVEACNVVVSGRYSHIVLVVVDRGAESYGPNGAFWIRSRLNISVPVFTGQQNGVNYNGFANNAYGWLGRDAGHLDWAGNPATELPRAWSYLCQTVSLPGMADRIWTMAAELGYTRRIPCTVTPGVLGAAARRFDGLRGLGDQGIAIDGTNMTRWDIEDHTAEQVSRTLRAETTLRHTAAGIYPNAVTYIAAGANRNANIPCVGTMEFYSSQYSVNSASGVCRVAIAAGIYVKECKERIFPTSTDAQVYCQGLSSLMLGVFGWIYGSSGSNAMLVSGMRNVSNMAPQGMGAVVPTSTDSFVTNLVAIGAAGIGQINADDNWWNVSLLLQQLYGDANAQDPGAYPFTNVPFWYVMAVMTKFGIEVKPRQKLVAKRFTGALAAQGRKLVYKFDADSQWTDLHLAMSDLSYEDNHWYFATVNTLDAALTIDEMFWYPDAYIDDTKQKLGNGIFNVASPMAPSGIISITMSSGDYTTQYVDNSVLDANYMRTEVWGQTPVQLDRPSSFPVVIGGLRYPDPFWEWLWEGAKKIGPHILTGNYGQAAMEAFSHLAKPAAEWAGEKVKTWVDNRFQ